MRFQTNIPFKKIEKLQLKFANYLKSLKLTKDSTPAEVQQYFDAYKKYHDKMAALHLDSSFIQKTKIPKRQIKFGKWL